MKLKHLFSLIVFLIIAAAYQGSVFAVETNSKGKKLKAALKEHGSNSKLCFKWAVLHRDQQGRTVALNSSKKPAAVSGDFLKIFIKPVKNVFVYVYLYDSKKVLSPLFPEAAEEYKIGKAYYIPGGNGWFELDSSKGIEIFHIIASKDRLVDLENLTKGYLSASKVEQGSLKAKVLAEIKNLKKRFSRFAAAIAEKPVPIAGTSRGPNESLEKYAVQVEAQNFYGKTFRLEHK